MFGVSIGPPYEAIAENPTSSSTAYPTFGAPSGAFGGANGDQSGTESRMSTLILPLNGTLITLSLRSAYDTRGAMASPERSTHRRSASPGDASPRSDEQRAPAPAQRSTVALLLSARSS